MPNSYLIQRELVVPDPDQPRQLFDEQEMGELAASIQARGIKQPLTVRWNVTLSKYMIIDGGRRYEAAKRLGIEELPCWIHQGDGKEVLIDQIVHNWQRADLRPYETADALARLRDEHGLNQQKLAQVTGKPKGEISKLLALHDKVVPEVQQMVRNEDATGMTLTKRHLYNISKLKADEQQKVAEEVRAKRLTAVETEQLVWERSNKREARSSRRGIAARQRRFHTSKADVLMTFRSAKFTEEDVVSVVEEMRGELR